MNTYLLTWNPLRWEESWSRELREMRAKGTATTRWSVSRNKRIEAGDRLFLMRQGKEPRGIVASGKATSAPFPDEHWSGDGRMTNYVYIILDALLDPNVYPPLPREELLAEKPLSEVHWDAQSSGNHTAERPAEELERRWRAHLRRIGWDYSRA